MDITKKLYRTFIYGIYILYVVVFLGLWSNAPSYLNDLNYYLKIFVGLILVYVYNPIYKMRLDNIHKEISFSAGILLLTSTSLDAFQKRITNTYKKVTDELIITN